MCRCLGGKALGVGVVGAPSNAWYGFVHVPGAPGAGATGTTDAAVPGVAQMASLSVESSVAGADIEIDGSFVGSTPSTLSVAPGQHTVTVKKKGYEDWTRSMNVAGNSVPLSADLVSKAGGN